MPVETALGAPESTLEGPEAARSSLTLMIYLRIVRDRPAPWMSAAKPGLYLKPASRA